MDGELVVSGRGEKAPRIPCSPKWTETAEMADRCGRQPRRYEDAALVQSVSLEPVAF